MGGCCCKKKSQKTQPEENFDKDQENNGNTSGRVINENLQVTQDHSSQLNPLIQQIENEKMIANKGDITERANYPQKLMIPESKQLNESPMEKKRPAQVDTQKKETFFYSFKFLPINVRTDYKTKFKHLPPFPDNISDQAKEILMTLNIARDHPIYFSNNVLEAVRDRIHSDKFYNSFSSGMVQTVEGTAAIDSLLDYICKVPKLKGLNWNHKLAQMINVEDIKRIDIFNANIFDIQHGEEQYLRETLLNQCNFNYKHLYVFFEFNTSFGFEVVCNFLRDDGNAEKDVRKVLLSSALESIAIFHERHITGNMITYVVVTSEEITKEEFSQMQNGEARGATEQLPNQDDEVLIKKSTNQFSRRQSVARSLISDKLTEKLAKFEQQSSYPHSLRNYNPIQEEGPDAENEENGNPIKELEKSFQVAQYIMEEDQQADKSVILTQKMVQPVYNQAVSYKKSDNQSQSQYMQQDDTIDVDEPTLIDPLNLKQINTIGTSAPNSKGNPSQADSAYNLPQTNKFKEDSILNFGDQNDAKSNLQKYNEQVEQSKELHKKKKEKWELDSNQYFLNVNDKKEIEKSVDEMMNFRMNIPKKKY